MFRHSWKYAWLAAPSPKKQTATRPWRCGRQGGAQRRGDRAADDPVAADQAVLEVDHVHRAGAAAADAGGAPEHLGDQRLGIGALGQRVPVAAVGAGGVVVGLKRHADPDRHRLLPGVQMGRAVDLAAQEQPVHRGLELPDQEHARVASRYLVVDCCWSAAWSLAILASSTRCQRVRYDAIANVCSPELEEDRGRRNRHAAPVGLDGGGHDRAVAGRRGRCRQPGEPLVEVETDKATVTYEAEPTAPCWRSAPPRATASPSAPDRVIGEPVGARRPAGRADAARASAHRAAGRPARPPAPSAASGRRVKASPLARRIAAELGVDLAALAGSGPHGG